MDSYEEAGYPFTVPDLLRSTNLATFQDEKIATPTHCWILAKHGLDWGLEVEGENQELFGFSGGVNFSIPDLEKLEFSPLEDLEPQDPFSPVLTTDDSVDERGNISDVATAQPIVEDICLYPDVIAQAEKHRELKSWELFYDSEFKEPQPGFISERGAVAFDTAVITHEKVISDRSHAKYGRILQSDPLLTVSVHNQAEI